MKKSIICIVIIILINTLSCSNKNKLNPNDQLLTVDVALPITDSVTVSVHYPGYLTSMIKVDLVARISGFLESINFKAGDYVRKGQILFVIEPKIYKEALAQAVAELESAKSQKVYAQTNYNSTMEAAKSDAVSQIDLIQAENTLNQAIAAIANCEAAVATAKQNLSYCYVKAPVSGQISKSNVDIGNYLNGSVSPQLLATLYDDSSMYVNFSVPDKMYLKMISGNNVIGERKNKYNVTINFAEKLKHEYLGELDYMSPNIDLSMGTLNVRAIVANPYRELKNGMYATVSLPIKEEQNAILVNDASIGTDQLGKYMYVVNDSNEVVYTTVKIGGLYFDSLRVINRGLTPKQRYVTKALLKVRNGMRVKPILTK